MIEPTDHLDEPAAMPDLDPIDRAAAVIRAEIEHGVRVVYARTTNPDSHPWYGPTPTLNTIYRRTVGQLLELGWSPPAPLVPDHPGAGAPGKHPHTRTT